MQPPRRVPPWPRRAVPLRGLCEVAGLVQRREVDGSLVWSAPQLLLTQLLSVDKATLSYIQLLLHRRGLPPAPSVINHLCVIKICKTDQN